MMKVCVLLLIASLPALPQFGDARSLQHQPIKPGMTCASDAYVLTWVAARSQFECLAASGAPTGAAGGVLGGTYPSPTFAGGASFNADATTFLNGAGSFTSPGTANARITFSNVASATMTLTGVAVKAVVTCWDSSVSPARLFIPDSVEQTDADTLTFNFSPNATGYCDGSTGIGLTGATGPTGPAGGVSSLTGTANQIVVSAATGAITVSLGTGIDATKIGAGGVTSTEFGYLGGVTGAIQTQLGLKAPLASPTFTGTVAVGASVLDAATSGIAAGGLISGSNLNIFTAFSGPGTSLKTFALPNASAAILTTNAAVTGAQGGTGVANTGLTVTLSGNVATTGAFDLKIASQDSLVKTMPTGTVTLQAALSSSNKLGLAAGGTNADLSATGGTSQVLKQTSVGGAIAVGQLACSDLSNASATCATAGATVALDNLASVSINSVLKFQTGIAVGDTTNPAKNIVFNASGTYGTGSYTFGGTPTANRTISLPDNSFTAAGLNVTETFTSNQTFSAQLAISAASQNAFRLTNASAGMSFDAGTPTGGLCWSGSSGGTYTNCLHRNADNVVEFNGGTKGTITGQVFARSHGSGGTVPGISGCTAGTQTGGGTAGTFSSGTSGACTVVLTFAFTAPTGWACSSSDRTTPANLYVQSASTTTSATFTGTTISGDVIGYACMYY